VALPKRNGYQSLHTTVIGSYGERMEVQIRTEEMHRNAELGIAAHWKYKEGRFDTDGEDAEKFAWLRQLLEWQRDLADPHEFLDTVKVDLFPEEVFVFTPNGEVMNLPQRATALDFAYAIHSEVGDQCAGAKVNGKMVPLRHVLHNGDTVEIQTSSRQFPRKDWLEFVVSSKARTRIRHALRVQGRERSIQLGRDILERECRKHKLSLGDFRKSGELESLSRSEGQSGSIDELFSAVGYGKLSAAKLVQKLRGEEAPAEPPAPSRLRSLFRRDKRSDDDTGIRVSGLPDVLVRFGGCCDPLPGDDVIGFVTRGRGVTVHVRDCPRVFELEPDRRIDVTWAADEASETRPIKVRVTSVDQPGILAKVTKSISAAGINIGAATITTGDGALAVQSFELWVSDLESLDKVMKEIQRVKGVRQVERVRG
jgi:GTP pyrophosphokinase